MTRSDLTAAILVVLTGDAGMTPETVADAIVTALVDAGVSVDADLPAVEVAPLDPSDPAVTGVPRDETHDSVDVQTGTLTADAVAKRAADAQALADAQAKAAEDAAVVSADQDKLTSDQSQEQVDVAAVTAAQAALDADPQS